MKKGCTDRVESARKQDRKGGSEESCRKKCKRSVKEGDGREGKGQMSEHAALQHIFIASHLDREPDESL